MFSYTGNVHASFFCSLKFLLLFFEMIGIEATNCSLKFQWLQIKGASCVTIATGLFYLFIVGIYQRLIKLSLNLTALLFYSRTGTCFIYNCTSTKYSLVNCDLQFQYKMSNVFLCHKRIVIDCTLILCIVFFFLVSVCIVSKTSLKIVILCHKRGTCTFTNYKYSYQTKREHKICSLF